MKDRYSIKYNLPRSVMTSTEMRVILDECNFIVAVYAKSGASTFLDITTNACLLQY